MATSERINGVDDVYAAYRADVLRYPLLSVEQTRQHARLVFDGIQILQTADAVRTFVLPELSDCQMADVVQMYDFNSEQSEVLSRAYKACDTLIVSNLRYAMKRAKTYAQITHVPVMDLIQEANTGLSQAARKFDYRKGFQFTTYANYWVGQALRRGIDNTGDTIRVPVHMQQSIRRVEKAEQQLLGRGLTATEYAAQLAVLTSLSTEEITEVQRVRSLRRITSLALPVSDDAKRTLEEVISDPNTNSPEDTLDQVLSEQLVQSVFTALIDKPDWASILQRHFGLAGREKETAIEIATDLGVSRQAVEQKIKRALQRVRDHAEYYGWTPESTDIAS